MTAFLPLIAQVGMSLLNYFLKKKEVDAESKKIFIQAAEVLRNLGVKNAKSAYDAEGQISQIEEEWKNNNAGTN